MDIQGFSQTPKRSPVSKRPVASWQPTNRYALDNMPGTPTKAAAAPTTTVKTEVQDHRIMTPARFVRVAQKPVPAVTELVLSISGIRAFGSKKLQALFAKLAPKQIDKG